MKLIKLTMKNFMPYKGLNSIEFPMDDSRNIMLVLGDNMRGKTSLINALRWGFYNTAMGRHSRPIPLQNIINKDAAAEDDWEIEVHIVFEEEEHIYELRRTAEKRPQITCPTKPDDFIVTPFLSRDGVILRGDQFESEIDKIAPEQLSRFFLFDGELLDQYEELLVEGSEQGRQIKEAIEQVLGVPALINGRDELGAILKAAQKRQNHDLSQFDCLKAQAEKNASLTALLDTHEGDLKDLQKRLESIKIEREKLEDDLDAAASVLALKAKLDAAKDTAKTQQELASRKKIERKALLAESWKDLLSAKLNTKRDILTSRQKNLYDTLVKQSHLDAEIANIKNILSTKECPTCQQPFPENLREQLGTKFGKLEAKKFQQRDVQLELNAISAQLEILNKIKGVNAKERLISIDRDIRSAEVEMQKSENEIARIEDQIAGHDTAELARKRVLKDDKFKEEGRLTESIKNKSCDIQQVKEKLLVSQKAIEGLAGARKQKSTLKVSMVTALEKIFQVSIERLRDRLRKIVEHFANEAFINMISQKAYRGLVINDSYGLSILDSQGRKVSIRSAGAEHIVALSLIDGLNRTGRAIGPIIMDTPFGRLDPKHRDNIMNYLPKVSSQFVLLVHGGEIRPETDLASIKHKIGAAYEIMEVTDTQSRIERKK
ncbi:AAA family ATPase [Desulfovibrio sp. UIB00]|uniref:AAA family ATPase n=1 Tax=Desulfovibrio sp. UIB00 TaxID=2804314 RepID=UPI001F1070F2|nr:AAA family ATPase [Desulfovibrio sp. UIB00]MCH5144155.1 AAA family ATPase [Desulfovibrio sp. UIB00]